MEDSKDPTMELLSNPWKEKSLAQPFHQMPLDRENLIEKNEESNEKQKLLGDEARNHPDPVVPHLHPHLPPMSLQTTKHIKELPTTMQIPSREKTTKIEFLLPDEEISIVHQLAPAPPLPHSTPLQPMVVLDRCLPLQNKSQNKLEESPTRKRKIDSKIEYLKHSKKTKLHHQHPDAILPISLEAPVRLKTPRKKTMKLVSKDSADRENLGYPLRSLRRL
jgi:hypothetical protein